MTATTPPEPDALSERRESLWVLTIGPTLWATHFLFCYAAGAVWCEKFGDQNFTTFRLVIGGVTAAALVAIVAVGVFAFLRWGGREAAKPPHDADTPADRRRFLGFATLLLCGLSFVATAYTALPAALIVGCR